MTPQVRIVADDAGFEKLGAEWNGLLSASAADNLFLTWEWISTWWKVYGAGSRLNVLTARTGDGRLVGIAPLKRTKRRIGGIWHVDVIEFIGQGGDVTPEYLDLIVLPGYEAAVIRAFVDRLRAEPQVPVIDLRPFAAHSGNLALLREKLTGRPGRTRCVLDSVCPQMQLPSSPQAFMAARSRNYRKKIKEFERRVQRDFHARLRVSRTHDELQADFNALTELHARRWNGTSRAFQSTQYLDFHRRFAVLMLDRGAMRLFSLENESSSLASLYCFAYGGRYYYYQSGRDPSYPKHHLGLVLMHKVIQEAIIENATVFDFLRGEEPYKFHWAGHRAENLRLVHWPSLSMRAFGQADALFARMGNFMSAEWIAAKLERRMLERREREHA